MNSIHHHPVLRSCNSAVSASSRRTSRNQTLRHPEIGTRASYRCEVSAMFRTIAFRCADAFFIDARILLSPKAKNFASANAMNSERLFNESRVELKPASAATSGWNMYDVTGTQVRAGMGFDLGNAGSDLRNASEAATSGLRGSVPAPAVAMDACGCIPFSLLRPPARAGGFPKRGRRARRHRIREVVHDPAHAYSLHASVSRRSPP